MDYGTVYLGTFEDMGNNKAEREKESQLVRTLNEDSDTVQRINQTRGMKKEGGGG